MIEDLLCLAFAGLSLADALLTARLLRQGGKREANPVVAWLMRVFGVVPALVIFKGALVLVMAGAVALRLPYIWAAELAAVAATAWAVVVNARQVRP